MFHYKWNSVTFRKVTWSISLLPKLPFFSFSPSAQAKTNSFQTFSRWHSTSVKEAKRSVLLSKTEKLFIYLPKSTRNLICKKKKFARFLSFIAWWMFKMVVRKKNIFLSLFLPSCKAKIFFLRERFFLPISVCKGFVLRSWSLQIIPEHILRGIFRSP